MSMSRCEQMKKIGQTIARTSHAIAFFPLFYPPLPLHLFFINCLWQIPLTLSKVSCRKP